MFTVERNGAVEILAGEGPLTSESIPALRAVWVSQVRTQPPRLVFDMKDVPLIDSEGLDWLCDSHDDCIQRGGRLLLASPTVLCREILGLTGVDQYCRVVSDVQAGIANFAL